MQRLPCLDLSDYKYSEFDDQRFHIVVAKTGYY